MKTTANGISINYRIDGAPSGDWLTFVPGIGNDLSFWDGQMKAVERDFRILRYDPRGHGETDSTGGDYSFDLVITDIVGLWDALGIARSHVVGLGFGGSTTLGLALDRPDRVLSLAACCCRAKMAPDFAAQWAERIALVRAEGIESMTEATAQRWFTQPFKDRHPEILGTVRAMFRRTTTDGYCGAIAAFVTLDYAARLKDLAVPALFVAGGMDNAGGPPPIMAEMSKTVPDGRLVVIPDVGHICNIEDEAAFNAALAAFLNDRKSS